MPLRFQPARGASVLISSSSRGPTGSAATLTIGTTTTLAAGSSATSNNSGTTAAAILNLGVPRGADAGIKWLYDSSTSMADPGTGEIRFNNASIASATAIAVSATGSGVDVSDYVAAWDDSTNTIKGHLMIREEAAGVAAIVRIDSVVDNTDWLQINITYVSGSLALTAADPLYVSPFIYGNAGAVTSVGLTQPAAGITVSGSPITSSGNMTLALANDLAALEAMSSTGLVARTASETYALRTITGTSNQISVANGDGVSGNPTLSLPSDVIIPTVITVPNTGLHILDTNASHDLIIVVGSNLTADHTLTFTTGDADRVLTISGDHTLPAGTSAVLAGAQTITGGFKVTPFAAVTKSSGTYTPLYSDGNFQTATNGGAHTLAPPADDCTIIIQYTNNGSAGAITTSGFTTKTGDTISTTNGDDFFFYITKIGSFSNLNVVKLQ